MIDDLKPYAVMKDSGVPWLGQVPEHWGLPPNRALMRRRKVVVGARHADLRLLSLTKQGIIIRDIESGKGKFSADMGTSQEVRAGDLVFCLFDVPETPRTVALSRHEGMITGAYTVFECSDPVLAAFLERLYQSLDDRKLLSPLYSGLRNTIPANRLLGARSPLPPPAEQAAIVRFLDYVDRRIRRYIAAKQKLIKLLEEQKQAIIHRAVTRGLDPNVHLKASGVEWLGDVPEHWEVTRLARHVELTTGFPFKSEGFSHSSDDVRLLRGINISPGRVRWDDVVYWPPEQCDGLARYELKARDIVLGMDRPIIGAGVRIAMVCETDLPALLLQRVARVRPGISLRSRFLMLLLSGNSFMSYLRPIFTGISVPHLSPEQIRSFRFALPSIAEQDRIADQVALITQRTQSLIEQARREISLLHEYRTRLIADVVTGKLDVRETAAQLLGDAEPFEMTGGSDELELSEGDATEDAELELESDAAGVS